MSKARSNASNDARSRSMNPQDPVGRAAADNHANQLNPNNPAHPSATETAPTPPAGSSTETK